MTIAKKLGLAGGISVLALTILYGVMFFSQRSVNSSMEINDLRNEQLQTLNAMQQAKLDLVLAAMDSIIDKDAGTIDKERLEIINKQATFLTTSVVLVAEAADTPEEKAMAAALPGKMDQLIKGIQQELVELIEESGAETKKIEADFNHIDDILDKYGDAVGDNLATFEQSLQARLAATSRKETKKAASIKTMIDQVNYMRLAHLDLMLVAMDSIIDKNEGNISTERMDKINQNTDFLNTNLANLSQMAETVNEKTLAADIVKEMVSLDKGIREDLKELIEKSAIRQQEIDTSFPHIDDILDEYSGAIGDILTQFSHSVAAEQNEAEEDLAGVLSTTNIIALLTYLIGALGLSIFLYKLSH